MSISLNVKMSGLQELRAELAGFSDRRLRAAAATGLTRTAKRLAVEWQKEIDTKIDQPMAFTKKATRIEAARADSLTAKVALKDVSRGGMSQAEYLQQHEYGGGRLVKKFERALIASGAMPQGYITVPGKGVDRNGYGNVSRGSKLREDPLTGVGVGWRAVIPAPSVAPAIRRWRGRTLALRWLAPCRLLMTAASACGCTAQHA